MSEPFKLRSPKQVMRLARLGSFHASRLSFMRILLRRLSTERWQFERREFVINAKGEGHAVYVAKGPYRSYALVAFCHDLPDHLRSDRVIAKAWDTTFTLYDGIPTTEDIERLAKNVPLQEAGRVSESELILARANKSVRLWEHVVEALSQGRQPEQEEIDKVGYLMRTTAVYGSGKFGAADRMKTQERAEMQAPFQAEMLGVYLMRAFVKDLVEERAKKCGAHKAIKLAPKLALRLGIGNSTGLGMAPFIINHPRLFNNWIMARETAIARVRALEGATPESIALFLRCFEAMSKRVLLWNSEHPIQLEKLKGLRADMKRCAIKIASGDWSYKTQPWDELYSWAEVTLSLEGQEAIASLILEPYGDLVDDCAALMANKSTDHWVIESSLSVSQVCSLIEEYYDWALDIDFDCSENNARLWYVSQEKLEPRLGERVEEPELINYEQALAPARDIKFAYLELTEYDQKESIAQFLCDYPQHRLALKRLFILRSAPYAEIRDNTIDSKLLPIDMLRCKLSFFGATNFDPRSDRWVRICMYQGAPYPEELNTQNSDFWNYCEEAL